MSSHDVKAVIKRDIERYRSLRRHHNPRSQFNTHLSKLQNYQQMRMRQTYDGLFGDPHHRRLIDFFLREMYSGLDMSHLGSNVDKAINLALKLVSNPSLIAASLEFNALTAELDELLTAVLFESMGVEDVNHDNYNEANRLANTIEVRRRQIELIRLLSRDLDRNSKSKVVYSAFKLAKTPAKLGGLADLYNVLASGFDSIRYVKSPESLISTIMDQEAKILEAMFADGDVIVVAQ